MGSDLKEILWAGLAADDAESIISGILSARDGLPDVAGRVFLLSAGKAAGVMSRAALGVLGDRVDGGLVVAKQGNEPPKEVLDSPLEVCFASHPEPDEGGVEAARRVAELAESVGEGDLLLLLLSGGASALLADPASPVELGDLKRLTGDLLRSGASIEEINTVRKHVSTLKGGRLASMAAPARTLALILSDVVGDDPAYIASGPTVADSTTLSDALGVLKAYGIVPPPSVTELLDNGSETPKPGDPMFDLVENVVCGSGHSACQAAAIKAKELGYPPLLLSTSVTGDARAAAGVHAAVVREVLGSGNPVPAPCALISGGETTVVVRSADEAPGTGGPNQEFALTLALELEGVTGWAAFSADTDGNDGPTDAAGGLVDGATAELARKRGTDPRAALNTNDSYAALDAAGALIKTGPTGTNVNDLRIALVYGD